VISQTPPHVAGVIQDAAKQKNRNGKKKREVRKAPATPSPFDIKEGDTDPETGAKVDHLIAAYEDSIVFLDPDNYLHYWTRGTESEDGEAEEGPADECLLEIEAEYSDLKDVVYTRLENKAEQRRVMVLLGNAIDAIFNNENYNAAKMGLALARKKLFEQSSQELRRTVIWSSLSAALLALIASYVLNNFFQTLPGIDDELVTVVVAGIIGSALSLLQRSSTFAATRITSRLDYFLECLARFFIGGLAGAIALLAVKADMMFGFLTKDGASTEARSSVILLIALFAGISERFIPTFVKGIENQLRVEKTAAAPEAKDAAAAGAANG